MDRHIIGTRGGRRRSDARLEELEDDIERITASERMDENVGVEGE